MEKYDIKYGLVVFKKEKLKRIFDEIEQTVLSIIKSNASLIEVLNECKNYVNDYDQCAFYGYLDGSPIEFNDKRFKSNKVLSDDLIDVMCWERFDINKKTIDEWCKLFEEFPTIMLNTMFDFK